MVDRLLSRPPISGGAAVTVAAIALFIILWFPVLTGQRVLLGGDVLYQVLPWQSEPGSHAIANPLVSDPILQFLPWEELAAQDYKNGRFPLWNATTQNGAPLLANDQSAVLSPFTLLALPFPNPIGLSLAMLAKLLIAGVGTALFLRLVQASGAAAALGGIAYATSSYMVVWLAWPHTGVAALMPWAFVCVELYLAKHRLWALPALALVTGLQFLAGHAETSLHMGLALGLYVLVRWLFTGRDLLALGGIAAAAVVGALLAGIQILPFLDLLRHSTVVSDRAARQIGLGHLRLSSLTTWVFPNIRGNPSLDGSLGGFPNYNEGTGYAGVAVLVLSPLGAIWEWVRERSVAIGLAGTGVIAAGIVYGPLTPLFGRLPGLANSYSPRLLVVVCFCVATLGGLGLDAVLHAPFARQVSPWARSNWLGAAGLVAIALAGVAVAARGRSLDHLLPYVHGYIGFWVVVGLIAFSTATAFVAGGLLGGDRRWAATGLCTLALIEAAIFAGPFNPREPLSAVPPASPSIQWLQAHADGRPIAALGGALVPETASLYGLTDARSYDVFIDARQRLFWSTADPGYFDGALVMTFDRPGVDWLAAAGVAYVMMGTDQSLPGATKVYDNFGVAIAEVPNPRPFVYAATDVVAASGPTQAVAALSQAPMGPVVVEGCCPAAGSAQVDVTSRSAGEVELKVNAESASTIVVQQSFEPGWQAQIDGRPATIMPADVLFQAVSVPAGDHVLVLTYRPDSVRQGALLSAVGLGGLIILSALALARRRRIPST